jgi:hypothetical protein
MDDDQRKKEKKGKRRYQIAFMLEKTHVKRLGRERILERVERVQPE